MIVRPFGTSQASGGYTGPTDFGRLFVERCGSANSAPYQRAPLLTCNWVWRCRRHVYARRGELSGAPRQQRGAPGRPSPCWATYGTRPNTVGRLLVLLVVLFATPISLGARESSQPTCAVRVTQAGDDAVGTRLALVLKERVRKSPLYRLADSDTDWMFGIELVSVDDAPSSETNGISSAIAVAFLLNDSSGGSPKLLDLRVLSLGSKRIDGKAEALLGDLKTDISGFRQFCK